MHDALYDVCDPVAIPSFLRRNVVISEGGIGIETGNGEWPPAPAHGQIGRGRGHECRGENSNCLDDHQSSACVSGQNSITRNQIHFLSSVIIAQKFSLAVSLEVSII